MKQNIIDNTKKGYNINIFITSLALLLIFAANSCVLFQYADLSVYPNEQRTIFVTNFMNNTFQPDIHITLTRAVREEIQRRKNFILQDDRNDSHLNLAGEISVFRKEGRMYDNYRNPVRYELIVLGNIQVKEKNNSPEGGSTVNSFFSREISARVDYSPSEGFKESEREAIERLSRIFARKLNTVLEREFISHFPPPEN